MALGTATTNNPGGSGGNVTVTWTLYGQPVSQAQCNLSAPFDLVTVTLKDQNVSHNRSAFAPCKDGILHLTGVVPGQYTAEGAIYFSSTTGGGVASTLQKTVTVVDAQTATVNFDFQPSLVTLTTYQGQALANAAWVAFRNGNDQWRQIQGISGRYSFAPSIDNGGRYSLAIGCNLSTFAGAVFEVRNLELTTSDTTSPAVGCENLASRIQVSGVLSNIPAGHCVQGVFFNVNSALTGPDSACGGATGYSVDLPPGTYDFVLKTFANDGFGPIPDRVLIDPGIQIAGATQHPIDLSSAVATSSQSVTLVPGPYSTLQSLVKLHTRLNTETGLGASHPQATQFNFGGVPAGSPGNSIHELEANVYSPSQRETISTYFIAPAIQVASFSPPLTFTTTVTLASNLPYARPAAAFTGAAGAAVYQLDYGLAVDKWSAFVSAAWLNAAGGATSYQLPELTTATGFQLPPGYGIPPSGTPFGWTSTAHVLSNGTIDTLLRALYEHTESVGDGFTVRKAITTGVVSRPP